MADEVGLGKTVEVGLLVKEWLERDPRLRAPDLAPARPVKNASLGVSTDSAWASASGPRRPRSMAGSTTRV